MSKILLAAAILAVSAAPMANAANAPAANTTLGGPLIKGVCFLSRQGVVANTKVGQAAAERMKQLRAQVQAEIDASRGPIDADGRALQASAAKGDVAAPELERRRLEEALLLCRSGLQREFLLFPRTLPTGLLQTDQTWS